jgi:molybdopterin converting factor small subunit
MTRYRVATFARYAELLGSSSLEIDLPEPATTSQVVAALKGLPGGAALPERPLIAVNQVLTTAEESVGPGDELALLPPLAGG